MDLTSTQCTQFLSVNNLEAHLAVCLHAEAVGLTDSSSVCVCSENKQNKTKK